MWLWCYMQHLTVALSSEPVGRKSLHSQHIIDALKKIVYLASNKKKLKVNMIFMLLILLIKIQSLTFICIYTPATIS